MTARKVYLFLYGFVNSQPMFSIHVTPTPKTQPMFITLDTARHQTGAYIRVRLQLARGPLDPPYHSHVLMHVLDLSRRAGPLNTNTSNSKYLHTLYTLHQARTLPNPSDLRTTHSRSTRAVPPCCGRRSACHALRVRAAPARHQAAPRELAATDRPLRAPP